MEEFRIGMVRAVGSAPLQRKVAPEWRADLVTENGEDGDRPRNCSAAVP